mgnify:CR=1 FL=1
MNPAGKLRHYPGSPFLSERLMREQDRLRLFELHTTDSKLLAENVRKLEAHAAANGLRSRGKRILAERDLELPAHGVQVVAALLADLGAGREHACGVG